MIAVNKETQEMVLTSLESTLHKLSKASIGIVRKGGNPNLVNKRRDAIQTGIESLTGEWNHKECTIDQKAIIAAIKELKSMLFSVERYLLKGKEGSPQKTLNERRYHAITLAIASLHERT
jgi:hypothetical protein